MDSSDGTFSLFHGDALDAYPGWDTPRLYMGPIPVGQRLRCPGVTDALVPYDGLDILPAVLYEDRVHVGPPDLGVPEPQRRRRVGVLAPSTIVSDGAYGVGGFPAHIAGNVNGSNGF